MDQKDAALLGLLRKDARMPIVTLAREIGLSRTATQERLSRLLNSGIIRGFTTVEPEPAAQIHAHLMIRHKGGYNCNSVMPILRRLPGVVTADSTAGDVDMVVRVSAASVAEIHQIRNQLEAVGSIQSVTTYIVLERLTGQ